MTLRTSVCFIAGQAALICVGLGFAQAGGPLEPDAVVPSLNPLSVIDKQTLTGFRERPLFAPSRRVQPVPLPAARSPVVASRKVRPAAPKVRLLGVMLAGSTTMALVRIAEGTKTLMLRTGDTLDTWTVLIVAPQELQLQRDEETVSFKLFSSASTDRQKTIDKTGLKIVPIPVPDQSMIDRNSRLRSRSY